MPAPALKLNKLFNAYNTTLRMLQDRGCVITAPAAVVEALAANPTGHAPVSLALLKKIARPDSEETQQSGLLINRAALTITCTLSDYVMQLTNTVETNAGAPLMQVAFVEEESTNLGMATLNDLREAARDAGAQWLTVVADCKIPAAIRKEADELNVGWTLLTSSNAVGAKGTSSTTTSGALTSSTGGNGIVTDIVERSVAGLDIPAGAKPRRAAKKSTAAATDASAAAMANAFMDENQPLMAVAVASPAAIADSDSETDNAAEEDGKKKDKKKKKNVDTKPRPLFVELFEEDDLVFSPFRHSLAPKHRVLAESEVEQLLREKGATLPQLPRMEFIDPVARHFGLQRGAVVHITRAPQSDVVGEHSMYRHIV